jgi:hypothetical protein
MFQYGFVWFETINCIRLILFVGELNEFYECYAAKRFA